jgi:hypothetical protein
MHVNPYKGLLRATRAKNLREFGYPSLLSAWSAVQPGQPGTIPPTQVTKQAPFFFTFSGRAVVLVLQAKLVNACRARA